MQIKSGVKSYCTDDFFYDLFYGGGLDPEDFLDNEDDIKRVQDAVRVLSDYQDLLIEGGFVEDDS